MWADSILYSLRQVTEAGVTSRFPTLGRILILLCCVFSSRPAIAQQQAIFCLSDGSKITATRFEADQGKFRLYVTGSVKPLEYPASAIKGINVDPCPISFTQSLTKTSGPYANVQNSNGRRFGVFGSNTIGERLMPMLIYDFAKQRFGTAPTSKITNNEEQEIRLVSRTGDDVQIDLRAHGSATAAKGLIDGTASIGMSSRPLLTEEAKAIKDKFRLDARASENEHVLALDGVAVIVHPTNSVGSLSLEQIADVFSGRITNWKDLGGQDHSINVLRRDDKSGTFDVFRNLVLSPDKREISPNALRFESSELLSEHVSRDPYSIGFVGLPYINRNTAVSIASSCGITSSLSQFSIKTEEYPLSRRLYLYTLGKPSEPLADDLLQFALSHEAQKVIAEADFIEQSISLQDEREQGEWLSFHLQDPATRSLPAEMVDEFRRLASKTRRSSLAFRFTEGGATLDNKATQDVDRLVDYLQRNMISGDHIFVVGFTDGNGDLKRNRKLAFHRAAHVAMALERKGVSLGLDTIKSFANLAPVACNDQSGAAKNRRVEVWIEM